MPGDQEQIQDLDLSSLKNDKEQMMEKQRNSFRTNYAKVLLPVIPSVEQSWEIREE